MTYQNYPCLVQGIKYQIDKQQITFINNSENFTIDFESETMAQAAGYILEHLNNADFDISFLKEKFDFAMQPYSVSDFVVILDEQHLLSDAQPVSDVISGRAFICEIENYYFNIVLPAFEQDEFSRKVFTKTIDNAALKRWSVEYYHVTRAAERVLTASLRDYNNDGLTMAIRDFFFDEVGHEKLLHRSLRGFGMSEEEIELSHPHLCTETMMAMLLRAAHFHLPTFVTLVTLMEGNSDESQIYIDVLENSNLSSEAIQSQIVHEKINIEGEHGNEGREIFSHIAALSVSDLDIAKKAVRVFYAVRRAITPWLLGEDSFAGVDKALFRQALSDMLPLLKMSTLPIAIPRATLSQSERLVKMLCANKHQPYVDFNLNKVEQLLMLMLENVLWKAAYTDLTLYLNTLEWLEHLAEDRISEHRKEHVIASVWHVWHTLPSQPQMDAGQLLKHL
ncbi:iron-containing redox enzyme family protein [Brenneria uluponensis]|uniref:iron-containing redox enzyme family protein n=1 Tax=Brenneria uluponensis TaxID=3057057 RepID=UPI0028EBEE00|nr:iron-containing redox enzyme family protein [Brenneria ulupoensis]